MKYIKMYIPYFCALQTGFVKAFSSSPQAFTVGFSQVEHIMKTLFVRNLYLWPRFHATVTASLEKCKVTYPDIVVHCLISKLFPFHFLYIKSKHCCLHSCELQVDSWKCALNRVNTNSGIVEIDLTWHLFIGIPVINTFTAIVDLSRFNNSCLKSPASTLVNVTFQSRALRSFSLNQLRNLSL